MSLTKIHRVIEPYKSLRPYVHSLPNSNYVRRQDFAGLYSENGAIFLQRTTSIMHPCNNRVGSLFSDDARAYVMPRERSLDIDEPYDLELARALIISRKGEM